MSTKKIILAIFAVVIIFIGAWYFYNASDEESANTEEEGVVAVVNEEEVSKDDFETLKSRVAMQQGFDIASLDEETKKLFEQQIVDELVNQVLLEQVIDEMGVSVSQEEVDNRLADTKEQLGGEEAFEQALIAEGLSEEELRSQISLSLRTQAYLEEELDLSSVEATDEEVEALYAQEAAQSEDAPAFEDVRDQVEEMVIQQKQQALFEQFIQELRSEADIQILI